VKLLDGLVRHAGRPISFDQLAERLVGLSLSTSEKLAFKSMLEEHGVLTATVTGHDVGWMAEDLSYLRWAVEGTVMGIERAEISDRPISVITLPSGDYDISTTLERRGVERASLGRTVDAFATVARSAKHTFIVATPFIDAAGVNIFNTILSTVSPSAKCYLIVRKYEDVCDAEAQGEGRRVASNTAIMTYYRERLGRNRETFHGKYIVADDSVAYVGSANLLHASLESTVETGVLLKGLDAKPLSILACAMLESSTLARSPS